MVDASPTSPETFAPSIRAHTARRAQVIEEIGIAQQR